MDIPKFVLQSSTQMRKLSVTAFFLLLNMSAAIGQEPDFAQLNDTAAINRCIRYVHDNFRENKDNLYTLAGKILSASERLNYIQGKQSAFFLMGRMLKRAGSIDSGKIMFKKSIALIEKYPQLKFSFESYGNLANLFSMESVYDSALYFIRFMRDHSIASGDTTNYITATNNMSIIYRYLGQWDSSLIVLEENEKMIRLTKDTVRLSHCIHLKGTLMQAMGNVRMALEYYFEALNLLKKVDKPALVYLTQLDIATLYLELKEYRQAIDLLNSIKEGYESEIQGQMTFYNTIGSAYQGLNKFDSAYFYFSKSIEVCLENKQYGKAAIAYNYMGDLLNEQGKYSKAVDYLRKGKKICEGKKMKQQYARLCNSLGVSYLKLNQPGRALSEFSEALKTGEALNDISILKNATNGLHEVNSRQGNYKAAYQFMVRYKTYSDSLLNAENIRTITTKDLEYAFNQEKETMLQEQARERMLNAEILKRQKLIRNSIILFCLLLLVIIGIVYRNYKLKKRSDDDKAALMKEIHHRVKNNLQIVSSLLNIQTEYLRDARVKDAVMESQGRVKAMALIHQLLYQEKSLKSIDFRKYLDQLGKILTTIFKKPDTDVSVAIQCEDIELDVDISIPLGLIVTELVSNSFKYAFDDGKGEIKIVMNRSRADHYEMTIGDNGKGLPENFDIGNTNSMGLKLVKILSDQVDADLSFANDHGAIFRISFKGV